MSLAAFIGRVRRKASQGGTWLRDHLFAVSATPLIIYCILVQIELLIFPVQYGGVVFFSDPLLMSGAATYVVALFLAQHADEKMRRTVRRLIQRDVLSGASTATLDELLQKKAGRGSFWGCVVAAAVVLGAFFPYIAAVGINILVVLEVCLACSAGYFLGRMATYGRLGTYLRKAKVRVKVEPGHPDGVAGLKPLGEFYFFQATVVAIPGVFLGSWLVVLTVWETVYESWKVPYLLLLGVALAFFNLAFIVPLWWFHKTMSDQKQEYLNEADKVSRLITNDRNRLREVASEVEREALDKQLAANMQRFRDIEGMPVWPVDARIRGKYSLSNLLLSLPIASFMATEHKPFKEIGVWLESFVKLIAS